MKIGIVSDIHCDADALRAAISRMQPFDRLLCLGDSINQHQFSAPVVDLLREHHALTIQGNHEHMFFRGHGEAERRAHANCPEQTDWLEAQPDERHITLGDRSILMVHATSWDSGGAYVYRHSRDFHRFGEADADIVLYGHTHVPLTETVRGTLIVNPGSVGVGHPGEHGFERHCATLDLASLTTEIIALD